MRFGWRGNVLVLRQFQRDNFKEQDGRLYEVGIVPVMNDDQVEGDMPAHENIMQTVGAKPESR